MKDLKIALNNCNNLHEINEICCVYEYLFANNFVNSYYLSSFRILVSRAITGYF